MGNPYVIGRLPTTRCGDRTWNPRKVQNEKAKRQMQGKEWEMDRNLTTHCEHPGLVTDVRSRLEAWKILHCWVCSEPHHGVDGSQAVTMRWAEAQRR
jgi:hypothetical protein